MARREPPKQRAGKRRVDEDWMEEDDLLEPERKPDDPRFKLQRGGEGGSSRDFRPDERRWGHPHEERNQRPFPPERRSG
ncbi:hypothetical protein C2845_PM05G24830 [Panicum miliaceum]|uniref:Uncharacterized protein n=1 Tax=Panicum miliaceum TaxID=4540 RepID=A0A3L6T365_PANMI|nr:hypothetical protein C2845_PM05G24830 [Panicum miliaceum]